MAFSATITSFAISYHILTTKRPKGFFQPLGLKRLPPKPIPMLRVTNLSVVQSPLDDGFRRGTESNLVAEHYIEANMKLINAELEKAVPLRHPLRLHESMRYTLMSSRKRAMSAMCIVSCMLVGGDVSRALPVACALEMILTATLIHDDLPCMDDGDLRRGKPANHKVFDEATTLLAGNALLCLAFEHLARHQEIMSPKEFVRVMLELTSGAGSEGLQGGQMMDKQCEGQKDVSPRDMEYIHTHKTAKMIGIAVACGAIVGGGSEDEVERLRRFGTKAGFLFQVADDIADVTKTREAMGKNTRNDLAKDKLTCVKLMGVEGARNYSKQLLDEVFQELSYFEAEKASPLRSIVSYFYNMQN